MSLIKSPHRNDLREAGWHTRGYLPHFDGRTIPQFITLRLFDSVPDAVLQRWIHLLMTRFDAVELADIMQSYKSLTAHKANKTLRRKGQFWMEDYFDRYIRNAEHFAKTVRYIENNPVKARLCKTCSSAWFRDRKGI